MFVFHVGISSNNRKYKTHTTKKKRQKTSNSDKNVAYDVNASDVANANSQFNDSLGLGFSISNEN